MKNLKNIALYVAIIAGIAIVPAFTHAQQESFAQLTTQMGLGATGSQVSTLQGFLATDPSVYPRGLVTGYFGGLTQAAVKAFQAKYGISQTGYVGPITLARVNSMIGAPQSTYINPAIMNATANGYRTYGTVTWNTNIPSQGTVYYSSSPLFVQEAPEGSMQPIVGGVAVSDLNYSTSKTVTLSNLTPGIPYYYLIKSQGPTGGVSVTNQTSFNAGN